LNLHQRAGTPLAVWVVGMVPRGAILDVHLLCVVDSATDVRLNQFSHRWAAIINPNPSVRSDLSSEVWIDTILDLNI
jgi:hypothetical protein